MLVLATQKMQGLIFIMAAIYSFVFLNILIEYGIINEYVCSLVHCTAAVGSHGGGAAGREAGMLVILAILIAAAGF